MKSPSDRDRQQADLRAMILGMGERSIRKSYYPAFRRQVDALERYRELLHRADNAICLLSFPSLRFLDTNPSACRLFDVSASRQAEKCLPETIDPHSAEAIEAWTRDPVLQAGQPLRLESRVSSDEEGGVIDLTLTLVHFRDDRYVVCVAHDITERKEAERELCRALAETETSRAKIDAILRSVSDGLLVVGLDGSISLMNLSAESFLERSAADACSGPFEETVHQEELQSQIRDVLSGEDRPLITEFEMSGPSQKVPRIIRAKTTSVIGQENRRTGAITILHDISQEKALDRMKDEFISTAAHELRTPLTSLMGYSELLRQPDLYNGSSPAQQQEFLDIIYQKAEELGRIVDDLLDLSRVQSGKPITLDRHRDDLGLLLHEIVQGCREKVTDTQVVLDLPEYPLNLEFDRTRITQLMQNLLSNAIKFSPRGTTIRVFARKGPLFCTVGVEDEGAGMSPDELDHIFDKFYRVDASNTGFSGLGLGMSIVRQIVEAHGGEILVFSEQGIGTRVTFSLPLKPQPPRK
ncbi:ATP-binding protein [Desulfuromonas sp. TF]|uniref:PAS domain-containing sensor histidine kinase n=1 Tax=Desulfuromonas sp. TF TaxID=1232410 RepID=UPI00048062D5|nr:ATP-binding protein [Desulfuromonas sp. TF]